ncbi:hypothetical protein ElyMa_004470500 [Elysia marginata]|uniref:Cadherin Y-type LIR-motif domain-containing protein n=1 Tax=Elysia marginata TaxID=1093978 RepID=A0AAV4HKC7_9GAST|nr:hypothetical protein ElyMa_004470500 [Elysia marginata]
MSHLPSPLIYEPEAVVSDIFREERDVETTTNTTEDYTTDAGSTTPPPPTVTAFLNSTFTLTPEALNVTSTIMGPTEPLSGNSTSVATGATTQHTEDGGSNMGGTIAAILVTIILVIGLAGTLVFLYMRRRWKPHQKSPICFQPIRKRRSLTSDSRRALEELDDDPDRMADHADPRPNNTGSRRSGGRREQEELDAFTIDDLEEPEEEVRGGDEYYYDEVFGHSQFEDEATQNAVRQLYSTGEDQREEEMLDFDFETLGIKIEDYRIDPDRRAVNS